MFGMFDVWYMGSESSEFRVRFEWIFLHIRPAIIYQNTHTEWVLQFNFIVRIANQMVLVMLNELMRCLTIVSGTKFSGYLYHQIAVKWKQSRRMMSESRHRLSLYIRLVCKRSHYIVTALTQHEQKHLNTLLSNNNISPNPE